MVCRQWSSQRERWEAQRSKGCDVERYPPQRGGSSYWGREGVGRRGAPSGGRREPALEAGVGICKSTHETCSCSACRTMHMGTSKGPCHGRKIFRDGVMTVSQVSDEPHLASKSRGDRATRNRAVGRVYVIEGDSVVGWSFRIFSIRGLKGLARAEWSWSSDRINRLRIRAELEDLPI